MLKKGNNQLVSNTIISESLNTRRVTKQQQSAQTKASVPLNIPLSSTHVTTKVSKPITSYMASSLDKKKLWS